MNILESNCKGCVFATFTENKQTGCELGRTEKLNPEKKFDGNYQVCSRFCNCYRPQEWVEEITDIIPINCSLKEAVLQEVRPRIGFVINFQYDIKELEKTFKSLSEQEHCTPRYIVVINGKVEYNPEINELMLKYFSKKTICHIVQMLIDIEHDAALDHAFKFAKNGWICLVKSGYKFRKDFILKIHNRINIEMKRFMICYDEQKEKVIVNTPLFKMLNGNKPKILEDGSIDKRDFFGKLTDIQSNDPDSIISWRVMFDE